ncbi:hypothetical protein BCU43_009115 [Vibrio lentus]|nr:hypothetical protein [Vibrio lentus]PMI47631.1 hypothetical protein BCU43_23370 [Vibrio lentus]
MSNASEKYINAIDAIRYGTYTSKTLLNRKTVKLNYNTVEIEAGVTRGALKKHPNIMDKIDLINAGKDGEQQERQDEVDKRDEKYSELREQVELLNNKLESRDQLLEEQEDTLKGLQENEFHLISALFDCVPFNERDKLFESADKEESGGKIVRFGQPEER